MTSPRLRTIQKSRNTFLGRYKGHIVDVSRQTRGENWYLLVTAPNGCYSCDGWWRDSAHRTRRDAILEALKGAMLWAPPKGYNPDEDPTAGKPWPLGLDSGRMGVPSNAK